MKIYMYAASASLTVYENPQMKTNHTCILTFGSLFLSLTISSRGKYRYCNSILFVCLAQNVYKWENVASRKHIARPWQKPWFLRQKAVRQYSKTCDFPWASYFHPKPRKQRKKNAPSTIVYRHYKTKQLVDLRPFCITKCKEFIPPKSSN